MKHLSIIKSTAEQQHGIVTRRQLINYGCTDTAIWRMADNGTLQRLGLGVYRYFDLGTTWHQEAIIAVFLCGHNAYLSHESVLVYFGLLNPEQNVRAYRGTRPLRPLHVLANDIGPREGNILVHESRAITHEDLYCPSVGLPHVSIERAFVDCTASLTDTEVDFALQKAFNKRLTTPQKIMAAINRAPNGRGRQKKRLRKILTPYLQSHKVNKTTESYLEKRVQRIIERHICYECHSQYVVILAGKKYRLDFAIPDKKIAIEVDGFEFHSSRNQFDNDRIRQNALVSAGWTIVRITSSFSDNQITNAVLSAAR